MVVSSLVLVGASASLVAANVDVNGNNLGLAGSDTLYATTQAVLAACPMSTTRGIMFGGGGTYLAVERMANNDQRVAPAAVALKSNEYCPTGTFTNGGAPVSSPANTAALLLGVAADAVLANSDTTCSSPTVNGVGNAFSVPGLGTYVPSNSFETLTLLYFGLHNGTGGSLPGSFDCSSPQRRALVASWQNLLSGSCPLGGSVCTSGLSHAFRPADVSDAAEAFIEILNLPDPNRGLGSLSSAPLSVRRRLRNPFCNSHDANAGTTSYRDEGAPSALIGGTYWNAADMQDEDPIRVNANPSTATSTTGDSVARGTQQPLRNFAGTLGLVLPIFPPDAPTATASDAYPTIPCSTVCDLVAVSKANQLPNGFVCPDGQAPILGGCWQPVISSANKDPRCVTSNTSRCFGIQGNPDGRAYNLATIVLTTQLPPAQQNVAYTYQYAHDARSRIMTGSFYRLHMQKPAPDAMPNAAIGQTGTCKQMDAADQVGCLVDADRCSVGVALRRAAKYYPGIGGVPGAAPLKALAVSAPGVASTPPFTPGTTPDLALTNLLGPPGTAPFYPLSHRLYFETIFGLGNGANGSQLFASPPGTSGERELVQCFSAPAIVLPAMSGAELVPYLTPAGAIECIDYPEQSATTTTPPPNVQGDGDVAFGGCNLGGPGNNACL
jgi:hypothetical protein